MYDPLSGIWHLNNSIYLQKKKFIEEAAMFSEHKVTNRMS